MFMDLSPEYGVFITDIPHTTCLNNGYIKQFIIIN